MARRRWKQNFKDGLHEESDSKGPSKALKYLSPDLKERETSAIRALFLRVQLWQYLQPWAGCRLSYEHSSMI